MMNPLDESLDIINLFLIFISKLIIKEHIQSRQQAAEGKLQGQVWMELWW